MTPEQWAEIRRLALQIHDSGRHSGDQMKAAIEAFVLWLSNQSEPLAVEDDYVADDKLH